MQWFSHPTQHTGVSGTLTWSGHTWGTWCFHSVPCLRTQVFTCGIYQMYSTRSLFWYVGVTDFCFCSNSVREEDLDRGGFGVFGSDSPGYYVEQEVLGGQYFPLLEEESGRNTGLRRRDRTPTHSKSMQLTTNGQIWSKWRIQINIIYIYILLTIQMMFVTFIF